jgi:hypothetical protein
MMPPQGHFLFGDALKAFFMLSRRSQIKNESSASCGIIGFVAIPPAALRITPVIPAAASLVLWQFPPQRCGSRQ